MARSRAKARLNWVSQGQRWGRCRVRRRAERVQASGQGEEPPPEGLGGHDLLTQADAGCPAGQVVGHHLYRQPGAVGGEAARGEVVQPDAVLEVAYRVLDLGVAAMVSLQFQGFSVPVGDGAVIAVGWGEESNPVAKHSDIEASLPQSFPHPAAATRRDVLRSTLIPLQLAGDVDD